MIQCTLNQHHFVLYLFHSSSISSSSSTFPFDCSHSLPRPIDSCVCDSLFDAAIEINGYHPRWWLSIVCPYKYVSIRFELSLFDTKSLYDFCFAYENEWKYLNRMDARRKKNPFLKLIVECAMTTKREKKKKTSSINPIDNIHLTHTNTHAHAHEHGHHSKRGEEHDTEKQRDSCTHKNSRKRMYTCHFSHMGQLSI